jgi:hypothetical protein
VRLIAALLATLLLAPAARAQIVSANPVSHGAVTPETIDKRLEGTAERARGISENGIPRAALVDFSWAQDPDEYHALRKYVVVLISAVSQDAAELPLKRVYVVDAKGRKITLQKISSERRDVPKESPVHAMVGPYREDSFYLAPAKAMMNEGALTIDFAVRRTGFHAYELPGTPPDFIQADPNPVPAPGAKPDPKALKTLLEREYTGFKLPDSAK